MTMSAAKPTSASTTLKPLPTQCWQAGIVPQWKE